MHGERLCCPKPTRKANAGQHSVHAHESGKSEIENNIYQVPSHSLFPDFHSIMNLAEEL
jgi:hypothetical protein